MRQYLRLDPLLPDTKGEYPDGALAAFVLTLCFAEHQPRRGRFKTLAILKAYLGKRSRWIAFMLDHNDLVTLGDESLYVVGWDEWQEGDWQVAERMKRVRARRGDVTDGDASQASEGAVRTARWRIRKQVFERDSFTCRYCGRDDYEREWLIAEHIDPKGLFELENLATSCRPCNKKKGPRTPEQAGMVLLPVPSQPSPVTVTRGDAGDASRPMSQASPGDASRLSEPLAVSGRPLATSKHGDTAHVGDQANGVPAALSPQVQVVRVLDWFMARRGWSTWESQDVQRREAQQAIAIVELGIPLADVIAKLDAMWAATDPDDRPSSLRYFWTRLQDEQHATLKQDRSHASSGLTKLDVPTAAAKRRGERVKEGEA